MAWEALKYAEMVCRESQLEVICKGATAMVLNLIILFRWECASNMHHCGYDLGANQPNLIAVYDQIKML